MAAGYARYLLEGERVVVAIHQHWAKLTAPIAGAAAGLVVALWVDAVAPQTLAIVVNVVWLAWLASVGWAVWRLLEWRHDWFVATDKRLLLTYGLVTRRIAMMPLAKVTDMSYERSLGGRLLGYGEFILESAGQDQALRDVTWIPDPDATYRAICAEIFGSDDPDDRVRPRTGRHGDPLASFEREGQPPKYGDPIAVPSAVEDFSRPIPLPAPTASRVELLYESDDIRRRRQNADTGPMPRFPTDD